MNRTFEAPSEKVFDAFTEEKHLCNWWGSTPFDLVICELDFQINGRFFYSLVSSEFRMHGVFDYIEIEEPKTIRYLNYFADKDGFPIRHPMIDTWPTKMMNVLSFKEIEEKTELHINVTPYESTEIENETFETGRSSLAAGFKGTLDKLEKYLLTME